MPAIALWIVGGVAVAIGLRQVGETVESTGEGLRDAAIAGAIVVGGFVVLKKTKVI